MKYSWRIARIFGIDIKIDSSWLVIFVLFSWSLAGSYFPGLPSPLVFSLEVGHGGFDKPVRLRLGPRS